METLHYSRFRLIKLLAIALFSALFFGAPLFLPGISERAFAGALSLRDELGFFLFSPLMFLFSLLLSLRLAVNLADAKAIECTATHLVATGIWSRRAIAWPEVGPIELVHRRVKKDRIVHELLIHQPGGGWFNKPVRVALDTVELDPTRWQDYAEALAGMRTRMGGRAYPPTPEFPNAVQPENMSGNFDPDAALTRYAVRGPAPVVAPLPAAARGFGRKGL